MSLPIARTVGAVALAAALATSSTAAFAATTYGDPAYYATEKKKTTSLVGLSPELRTSAVQKARSSRTGTLKGEGGTSQSGPSDRELNLLCNGDWFITWDETANGDPILGTFNLHCAGDTIPIG
jgi:hypothetical protein